MARRQNSRPPKRKQPPFPRSKVMWFRLRLGSWGRKSHRVFPWRKTRDPYRILVAEIMLQQTFARKVVPVYEEFMRRYPSPKTLAQSDIKEIRNLILPLGFQYRARLLKQLGRELVARHRGAVPNELLALLALPGVGRYTANAVLCFAFRKKTPIVDTNVVRVFQRFFGAEGGLRPGETNKRVWDMASTILPTRKVQEFNTALLDFAALVCTHYNPECLSCPLKKNCVAAPVFLSRLRSQPVRL